MKPRTSTWRKLFGVAFTLFALVSMYGSLALLTLLLLVFPVVATVAAFAGGISVPIFGLLILYPLSWIPAVALLQGMLRARPPVGALPGVEVQAPQFPKLFDEVRWICEQLGTRVPTEVRVMFDTNACVMDLPHGRRVLCIGILLFDVFTLAELRAVLAHELAHFAFGHTAYAGIRGSAFHLFASLAEAPKPASRWGHWAMRAGEELATSLCRGVIRLYGYVYLRATRPGARRDEFEADSAAAALAGAHAMSQALEKVNVHGPQFDLFIEDELNLPLSARVAPREPLAWYQKARAQYANRDLTEKFAKLARERKTDPLSTHPALRDRQRALETVTSTPARRETEDPNAPASILIGDPEALAQDLVLKASLDAHLGEPTFVSLEEWEQQHLPAKLHEQARARAAILVRWFPQAGSLAGMARCLAEAIRAGHVMHYAQIWEPDLPYVRRPHLQAAIAFLWFQRLLPVYQGALLERGARVEASVGAESYRFVFDDGLTVMPSSEVRALIAGGEGEAINFLKTMTRLEERDRVLA